MKNSLAGNIARYRKENKLTQEELGNVLGVTYQAVSKWETGQSMPDVATLPRLAATLKVSVDKLLGYMSYADVPTYYENAYSDTDGYYWGVTPSQMCLKTVSLKPPGQRRLKVLDIGCGEGKDAVFFARCGYDVSAFDISDAGVQKTKRLAEKAGVVVNAFKADIQDYRLGSKYDILYSSGVFNYIKPELRREIMRDYKNGTNEGGLNVFNVFVKKPFIDDAPEKESNSHPWLSGELLTYYHDWFIEGYSETVFDCCSSGIPHRHAMNTLYSRCK